jgi:hypothetical protein
MAVTYHAVGKVLGGPSLWIEDARVGTLRNYIALDGARVPGGTVFLGGSIHAG